MKRALIIVSALVLAFVFSPSQELRHVTGVTNVEVPVRVYDGGIFVDNLTLKDFEVLENGVPQKVVAVYRVQKTDILSREENVALQPDTHRTFYLFFEIYEYIPRLHDALTYFVKNVLGPQDNFVVVTPAKTYSFSREVFNKLSRDQVVEQVNGLLRKDTLTASQEYRHILEDLKGPAKRLSALLIQGTTGSASIAPPVEGRLSDVTDEIDAALEEYRSALSRLEGMRFIDEQKILSFARFLKKVEGQKYVFLFYQREYLPLLDKKSLSHTMSSLPQNTQATLSDLFNYSERKPGINAETIQKAYSDSSIGIHFLYLTTLPEQSPGLSYAERSDDIFAPFLEISRATGGVAESTANPFSAMKAAADASENYYLLYYAPLDYKADGKFREIKVSVRGKNYRVMSRAGYFAN
jgi:hypothetical protein